MIDQESIRTDLALESQESIRKANGDIPGVKIQKKKHLFYERSKDVHQRQVR